MATARVPGGRTCEWALLGWCWGCGSPWGSCLPTCFVFPSSPFMNKFFPANFPNRQYQLLFTQGSGENKEGQCRLLFLALGFSHLSSPLSPISGFSTRARDGKGGLCSHIAWVGTQLCCCLHGGLWVNAFTSPSCVYSSCKMKTIHLVPPSQHVVRTGGQ